MLGISDEWYSHIWSFLAGAAVVGTWWMVHNLLLQLPTQLDGEDDEGWIEPWNNIREISWKVITTNENYGAQVTRSYKRQHWPWETMRRGTNTTVPITTTTAAESPPSSYGTADDDDSSLGFKANDLKGDDGNCIDSERDNGDAGCAREDEICIGSIFGLDVGGTLAKLVYFEQKQSEYGPIGSARERQYSAAASARAALLSRRTSEIVPTKPPHNGEKTFASMKPRRRARRRSLSMGSMDFDKQPAPSQEPKETEKPNMQSPSSEVDLSRLQELRQDSLPDDLEHFRGSLPVDHKALASESDAAPLGYFGDYKSDEEDDDDDAPLIPTPMRKSMSMLVLSQSQKEAVAWDRFYDFARRLDSSENSVRDHQLTFYSRALGGEFHFIHFETRRMSNAMDLIKFSNLHLNISEVGATGGGAHKFAQDWERMLGITMDKQEELDSLVAGMQFVLATVVGECYTFRPAELSPGQHGYLSPSFTAPSYETLDDAAGNFLESDDDEDDRDLPCSPMSGSYPTGPGRNAPPNARIDEWWWSRKVQRDAISYSNSYPYLLVTIGTGVSVLRVDGPRQHERISGSSIGGGTYWGLIRLLTDVEDFDDVLRLAEKGDPSKVDMMVGDIYGSNSDALEKLGLPKNIVASSFGKLVAKDDPAAGLEQEDLARALLLMITNNIGQVAYLNAQLHNTSRIYFVGNFLRRNKISQRRLSYAINYWSKGEMEALFLEHEGHFGALGAFLKSQKIAQDDEGFFQWDKSKAPKPR